MKGWFINTSLFLYFTIFSILVSLCRIIQIFCSYRTYEMINKISWQRLTTIILFIALIFIIYNQVLHFGFANIDDSVYVTQNSHVLGGLSAEGLKWAFTSTFAGFWHPITWLSLMLDAQIYGSWAGGYHLTNLLLHVVSSLILFMIFHRMTGSFWRSGFVATLFALHPLHVESVAWIGERKDVLSAFWGMLTIYAYRLIKGN